MTHSKATAFGIIAILIWSTFTALIRSLTESFGVTGGLALIYTIGAIFLCLKTGIPSIRKFPKVYLLGCGLLFVLYEILLSQAVGLADNRQQAIEVTLINYLWPSLVVLFSIWINQQRINFLLWPGVALSFAGVIWSISDSSNFDISALVNNIKANSTPYLLAFIAAILWGLYCNFSRRFNNGKNGVPLFFIAIAILLWIKFILGSEKILSVNFTAIVELIIVGGFIALSYSFWEIGLQRGNLLLLAILSYFTPIFSILFAAIWLNTVPNLSFWYGVIMVTLGSLLCWLATKKAKQPTA